MLLLMQKINDCRILGATGEMFWIIVNLHVLADHIGWDENKLSKCGCNSAFILILDYRDTDF
jgi:hypothetical protein